MTIQVQHWLIGNRDRVKIRIIDTSLRNTISIYSLALPKMRLIMIISIVKILNFFSTASLDFNPAAFLFVSKVY